MGQFKNGIVGKSMNGRNNDTQSIVRWIDYALMVVLSFFCMMYIENTGKLFAERHIQFSFLNFPIFIGEFLLMGCSVLLMVRMLLAKVRLNKWHVIVALYFCFVLIKAFWGYAYHGPLAFRDAALFYYFFFAVIGYYCYRPEFFKWWMILIYFWALLWFFFGGHFNDWWLMPRIFLALVLAYKFPDRRVGILIAAGVLFLTPYKYFLDTSRAIILGNFVSLAFLFGAAVSLVDRKKRGVCLISSTIIVVLLGVYIFNFSGNRHAQGIFALDKLRIFYEETEGIIQEKKATFRKPELTGVLVYNPEATQHLPDEEVGASPVAGSVAATPAQSSAQTAVPSMVGMKLGNSVFRLLIWRDAKKDLLGQKPVFGFDFGRPFRSDSLEIMRWGVDDWQRDGWIAMHNSYLNIVYRSGMVGIVFIIAAWSVFVYLVKVFIRLKSIVGLLLCAGLLIPLTAAYFSVTLELPHSAIPIWTFYGLVLAYANRQLELNKSGADVQRRV